MKRLKPTRTIIISIVSVLLVAAIGVVVYTLNKDVPAAANAASGGAATNAPTYSTVTEVFDWGPAVTKVIVNAGKSVAKDEVSKDSFKVHVVRTDSRPNVTIAEDGKEGDRPVAKAYVSDKDGNAADSGNYITLEMPVGPTVSLGYPINYDSKISQSNAWVKCDYTITQQKDIGSGSGKITGLTVSKRAGDIKKWIDAFTTGNFTDTGSNTKLTYAGFAPTKDGKKHPLIIWLRGTGEIGTDPTIPICANKSCAFASPEIQAYFGGAYVLSPQSSAAWAPATENALMALIQDYVSKNSDIDTNRIYVGGNSNGGYMTMLLAKNHTDYFAAAIPACEAMPDTSVTDADIAKLKTLPMWFTSAKTDTIVPPDHFAVPTCKRLKEAGAKNVHFSYFDKVLDTTGQYKKEDGSAYEYNGHFSFYYVFNNQCTDTINGKGIAIMQWLAAQSKSK